jgi:serine/threonine protein kinase
MVKQGDQKTSGTELVNIIVGGNYKLEAKIGQGGMAWVYRATHLRLGGRVAVKILFPQLTDNSGVRERFLREAQIQYQLNHPHIVRVLDFIEEPGLVGFVSEWCSGGDLGNWLHKRGSLIQASGEIRSLMFPLLDALQLSHQQGIIHRDLKPQNIMLDQYGDCLRPKLTDFGIAKQITAQGLTATGAVVGTLHYMAPEQIQESKQVDNRSDIYSIGVILYRMLAGYLPFQGEFPFILYQIMDKIPEAPAGISGGLWEIISNCLAKDPQKRFATCADLRLALEPYLDPAQPIMALSQAIPQQHIPDGSVVSSDNMFHKISDPSNGDANNSSALPIQQPEQGAISSAETEYFRRQSLSAASGVKLAEEKRNKHWYGRKLALWTITALLFVGVFWMMVGLWRNAPQHNTDGGLAMTYMQPDHDTTIKQSDSKDATHKIQLSKFATESPSPETVVPDLSVAQLTPDHRSQSAAHLSKIDIHHQAISPNIDTPDRDQTPRIQPNPIPPIRREPPKREVSRPICRKGNAAQCYNQALKHLKAKSPNAQRTARLYMERSCKLSVAQACYWLALSWEQGKHVKRDYTQAHKMYERACNLKNADACQKLGWFYQKGSGGAKNYKLAASSYIKACKFGSATACNQLGYFHQTGALGTTNILMARYFYQKACNQRLGLACFNMGVLLTKWRHIPKVQLQMRKWFFLACKYNDGPGCYYAAIIWQHGVGGQSSCDQANAHFRKACKLGYRKACNQRCQPTLDRGNWLSPK